LCAQRRPLQYGRTFLAHAPYPHDDLTEDKNVSHIPMFGGTDDELASAMRYFP
jgi:hypothetical protein